MKLHLALSGRCNLDCAYCVQGERRVRARMTTAVAEAALDLLGGADDPRHSVTLSGGEPFLVPKLVRHVVSSIRRRFGGHEHVECAVLTNGTLVSAADLAFLAEHDVELQVSFDGVPSAQAQRGPGTHETIVKLLGRALERHPNWARRRLSAAMVVQAATVATLARSVEGLVSMGLSDIRLRPLLTHDPGWGESARKRLEEQIGEVAGAGARVGGSHGPSAVDVLRGDPRPPTPSPESLKGAFCSASSAHSVAVDPDGRAWGCPSFMTSVQRLPPLGRHTAGRLDLGSVVDPRFGRRLADLPRRAGRLPLLRDRGEKWSRRGRCRDCSFFDECFVCPVATAHAPGNDDPHRVPDHQCDFQHATLKAGRRFPRPSGASFVPAPRRWVERSTEAP